MMFLKCYYRFFGLALFFIPLEGFSDTRSSIKDKQTSLLKSSQVSSGLHEELNNRKPKEWRLSQGVLKVDLVSQEPKLIEAFFIARGFSSEIAEVISHNCVFQMIVHNTGFGDRDPSITTSLENWLIKQDEKFSPIKLKEEWDKQWVEGSANEAARIAFRWAMFPSYQIFEPTGDYAWGMISMGLQQGEMFDLQIVWKENDVIRKAWIQNMQCPK